MKRRSIMKKLLIVVDMQKDFVDGALGSAEALAIVPDVCKKIASFEGKIIVTFDTHTEDYMNTREGKMLPVPHCIKGTAGHLLNSDVSNALSDKEYISIEKPTFGAVNLPDTVREYMGTDDFEMELCGLCTDICVVSNALILKAAFPEAEISVDEKCCAGVTPEKHKAALETMRSCQINVR
jgi:nicotinamidase-related amidase